MVEVLERGAALAEAASRTAGRRKRDILAVWVVVVRFGERIGGGVDLPTGMSPSTREGEEKKKKKRPDNNEVQWSRRGTATGTGDKVEKSS